MSSLYNEITESYTIEPTRTGGCKTLYTNADFCETLFGLKPGQVVETPERGTAKVIGYSIDLWFDIEGDTGVSYWCDNTKTDYQFFEPLDNSDEKEKVTDKDSKKQTTFQTLRQSEEEEEVTEQPLTEESLEGWKTVAPRKHFFDGTGRRRDFKR